MFSLCLFSLVCHLAQVLKNLVFEFQSESPHFTLKLFEQLSNTIKSNFFQPLLGQRAIDTLYQQIIYIVIQNC